MKLREIKINTVQYLRLTNLFKQIYYFHLRKIGIPCRSANCDKKFQLSLPVSLFFIKTF